MYEARLYVENLVSYLQQTSKTSRHILWGKKNQKEKNIFNVLYDANQLVNMMVASYYLHKPMIEKMGLYNASAWKWVQTTKVISSWTNL